MIEIWSEMYIGLHVKFSLLLSDFHETWFFSTVFEKKKILKHQISWKSFQWESSCSMRTDGQTDKRVKANTRFSQHCERANKLFLRPQCVTGREPWQPGNRGVSQSRPYTVGYYVACREAAGKQLRLGWVANDKIRLFWTCSLTLKNIIFGCVQYICRRFWRTASRNARWCNWNRKYDKSYRMLRLQTRHS